MHVLPKHMLWILANTDLRKWQPAPNEARNANGDLSAPPPPKKGQHGKQTKMNECQGGRMPPASKVSRGCACRNQAHARGVRLKTDARTQPTWLTQLPP